MTVIDPTTTYLYTGIVARNPQTGQLVNSAAGNVYDETDNDFANPLTVTDPQGNPLLTVDVINGLLVDFVTDRAPVWWKASNLPPVKLWTVEMFRDAAEASAADSLASRLAAEAAAANTTAPTTDVVRSVFATDLANPATQVATAVASAAGSAASTAVAPIAPTGGARAVGKGELTVNVRDYGAKGDGTTDDTAALQAAHNSGAAEVFYPAGTYKISGTITVASRQRTRGHLATIQATTSAPFFNLPASGTRIKFQGLELVGTMPANNIGTTQLQVGIDSMNATVDTPITHLAIEDCIFDKVQGTAIRLNFVQHFKIRNNVLTNYGYAGIGCLSVRWGLIEGNDLTGTGNLPSYSVNSYGVYVSASESVQVGTATNPKSQDVMIRGNFVTNQRWEALDTHVGERISFVNNTVRDCLGVGISCIYNDTGALSTAPHPQNALLSPRDILIEGNTITYSIIDETSTAMSAGIVCRGSVSTDTVNKERCTAIVRGNIVKRYGRKDLSATGGILLGGGTGMVVAGNAILECRVNAINVTDCRETVIDGNTFVDTWSPTSNATAIYIVRSLEPAMELTVSNNRYIRGSLVVGTDLPTGALVNSRAIHGTNETTITVYESNNSWGGGAPTFATQARQTTKPGGRQQVNGTAAPTTGTWLVGDEVRNTTPTAGGVMGWICVSGGTPGTWKSFGAISA